MKWNKIRQTYPLQWLLVEATEAYSKNGTRILEELSVMNTFSNSIDVEIIEFPEIVNHNESQAFIFQTKPGNVCFGYIQYENTLSEPVWFELEKIIADIQGYCAWEWEITKEKNVSSGVANFKLTVVEGDVTQSQMPFPFCITECSPWEGYSE